MNTTNKVYIIVDNMDELEIIQKAHPELAKAPLILLSDGFNPEQLASFKERSFSYFDDHIDDDIAKQMANTIHSILWSWYKSEDGEDLSGIDGLSLGITFSGSMEVLLSSIIKYEVAFARILSPDHEVYFSSNTDDVFGEVVKELNKKIKFRMHIIKTNNERKYVLYGKQKIKLDSGSRTRDLGPYFKSSWRGKLFACALNIMRRIRAIDGTIGKRILLFSAGKLDEYIQDKAKNTAMVNDLRWLLPNTSLKNILFGKVDLTTCYYFYAGSAKIGPETKNTLSKLEDNVCRKVKALSSTPLVNLMRKYVFEHVPGVVSYFKNALKELKYLKPDMVSISTDHFETHLILAQAARKIGIKTALLPHGIDDWGYKELRVGREGVIDYCFAYGKKHVLDNLGQGVSPDRVVITSFPYFSRFLPVKSKAKNDPYKNALVLAPDYMGISPASKQRYFFDFIRSVIEMLDDMDIGIKGIKSRGDYDYFMRGMNDGYIIFNNKKISWYTGYSSFPDIAKDSDCVIGTSSTALIEAGLMGIDYYVIYPKMDYAIPSLSRSVEKIMYVSHTVEELKENILNRRTFRPGYSIGDLIDLEGINNKENLYARFENSIMKVAAAVN